MIDLLQKIGLSKYEAEAYVTLLTQGALTGYELGKRSQVPLSRSYEILERLTQKHLALVQPGEPPRYAAEEPRLLFEQVRSEMAATLDALNASLDTLIRPAYSGEFWVVRGHEHILARALDMIAQARETLVITIPSNDDAPTLEGALDEARQRGCRIERLAVQNGGKGVLLLLVDTREALVGLLTPDEHSQAVVSSNAALVTLLRGYAAQHQPTTTTAPARATTRGEYGERGEKGNWLAWEERKQRHLWNLNKEHRVA